MKLGLGRNEVKLADYTPEWKNEFIRVKKELVERLGIQEEQIEHIGSTAIDHMAAKPIIDILVGVEDIDAISTRLKEVLKAVGFLRLRVQKSNEVVFAKFADESFQIKTHYIHLVNYKEATWNDLLFFRNYLNKNAEARKKYLEIKREYTSTFSTGIQEYTDYKEKFVQDILAQQLK
ncbi:GrpB family protein [Mangrovibacillus cuniculi]|uniref:GrpB family protein n=1 Tax=Mangrovibacillus cuniculi TaxID=2593652 RepID=A0A7S8C9J0_9BACI|nr:GrpB family protein [Mangrovibacillus cuniculi]QPC45869.1 GrpB family protein [Mangrovibacillus cuniculi]